MTRHVISTRSMIPFEFSGPSYRKAWLESSSPLGGSDLGLKIRVQEAFRGVIFYTEDGDP